MTIRKALAGLLSTAVLGGMTLTSSAAAQMQRSVFESLPVPGSPSFPVVRYGNLKGYAVDFSYLYRSFENYARTPTPDATQSDNPDNVQYVTLMPNYGTEAKIVITPFWDFPVPAAGYVTRNGRQVWADSCGHAHFGYAAFRTISVFNGVSWTTVFPLLASEGRVGRRFDFVSGKYQPVTGVGKPQLSCIVSSEPDTLFGGSLSTYIWKNNTAALVPATFTRITNGATIVHIYSITVAMQGATHGWGGCGLFQCFPKVAIGAYRTQ